MLYTRWLQSALLALTTAGLAAAQEYQFQVIARDLQKPTGIVAGNVGRTVQVFFTEVPTPGVPGGQGGRNGVKVLDPESRVISTINMGEPEPVNLAYGQDGALYWTCKSAGVILRRDSQGMIAPFLTDLEKCNGIAVDPMGIVFFTELPTPGVPGNMGGRNRVSKTDGHSIKVLTTGEPEPTDIAVDPAGTAYWTCKSAGVILKRTADGQVSLFLSGLNKPVGIALGPGGRNLYFTEVPTPGVPGSMGGGNIVWKVNTQTRARTIVHFGDPEPTDITAAADGRLFWTCTSAGVIVEARLTRPVISTAELDTAQSHAAQE
ncbi:MAG: hypothetical protein AB1716_21530 [Planctomycetota bacterium]